MDPEPLYRRYQELQEYVGWVPDDARRVQSVAGLLEPFLPALIDDFYAEIDRHPDARKVITGGQAQVARLKGTLTRWLRDLLAGLYDADYVARRWRAGHRHVEIGLDQVYANAALSRLRRGLLDALAAAWRGDLGEQLAVRRSLNTLLDLDLAIIEDAYQAEYAARRQLGERLAAQEELRRQRDFAESLIETAQAVVLVLDPEGRIVRFNRHTEQLTGRPLEEVRGKDWFGLFVPPAEVPRVREVFRRTLAEDHTSGVVNPIVTRGGLVREMQWSNQVLRDGADRAVGVLAVGQDVTALRQALERALQAERLAAIGQMMTGLAHESGNALARSQACLEMLAWEVQDRPEALDLIARVQKAQDHLRQLYEEVRGYAAPLRLEREVWGLAGVWRQAWDNLALRRDGKDAALSEETGGVDLAIAIDPFRLEQVFRNVLENALAACKPPVRIEVRCAETALDGRPAVRVAVRDNGPGLTPEQRQRIFEPFYTTKTKGTGLGMAIARRIVEAHGGRIAVGHGTGGGAEIEITLPREAP